ncbi:MAG TPA: hypothetical protein VL588_12800, partial [Bdellovibrionota bacterium]|nr:hypothetical protein [Bdellovibrionota bacterium]
MIVSRLRGRFLICLFACTMPATAAKAYSLTEHRRITDQAIANFNFCFNGALTADLSDYVQTADRNEDLNLLRKWTLFSHFFHPEKALLDQRRMSSDYRIADLQETIRNLLGESGNQGLADAFYELGHAIHHIQDMASPPHVVPVMHGLFDSYEGWKPSTFDYPSLHLDKAYCRDLAAKPLKGALYGLFVETARATIANVRGPLTIWLNGARRETSWEAFWLESDKPAFGQYGYLGDHFGEQSFQASDQKWVW